MDAETYRKKYEVEDSEREYYVEWLYKTVRPNLIKKWEAELEKHKHINADTCKLIKRFIKDLKYMA